MVGDYDDAVSAVLQHSGNSSEVTGYTTMIGDIEVTVPLHHAKPR